MKIYNWYRLSQVDRNLIRLWLDDERDPTDPKIRELFGSNGDEIWVKTPDEAISYLEGGNVGYISFDHDLGGELKGKTVSDWIEFAAYEGRIGRMEWEVHSKNPVGEMDIINGMKSAERFWGEKDIGQK